MDGAIRADLAVQRPPLFVTRFGLSDRTAIGVQTRQLLAHFPDAGHLYWHESIFDRPQRNSRRIENALLGRVTRFKGDTPLARVASRLTGGLWNDDQPSAALVKRLRAMRSAFGTLYFAPIDRRDAVRMRAIQRILELPFVLHLWDFLDGLDDAETRGLIRDARHVFCLSQPIREAVAALQSRTSVLPFNRSAAAASAVVPDAAQGGFRDIAIIGDIGAYRDGIRCLQQAVDLANANGNNYRITYIGAARKLRANGLADAANTTATGFLADNDTKDRRLARCAVGFLPGPGAAPDGDARSRYSIPSRVLDFMAVGLPLVGTVHPGSATFAYCRRMGLDAHLHDKGPASIAASLASLASRAEWERAHVAALQAFERHAATYNVDLLSAALRT